MAAEDRRVEKTRKIIDDACWSLMREKHFDEITVRDIALRANINRATFYRYHADKYDWIEKKLRQMVQELAAFSDLLEAARSQQEILDAFRQIVGHFDAHYSAYSILMQNPGTAGSQDLFKQQLLEANYKKQGLQVAQNPQQDLRFHLAVSAVVGAIEWWVKNDRPLTRNQLALELSSIHSTWAWNK